MTGEFAGRAVMRFATPGLQLTASHEAAGSQSVRQKGSQTIQTCPGLSQGQQARTLLALGGIPSSTSQHCLLHSQFRPMACRFYLE